MVITLKNCMRHPQFSFPVSKVSYPVSFQTPVDPYCLYAVGDGGVQPVQLTEQIYADGRVQSARAHFVTDLPCASEKRFTIEIQKSADHDVIAREEKGQLCLSNGKLSVRIGADKQTAFTIFHRGCTGIARLSGTVREKRVALLENGPVFAQVRIQILFENGDTYTQLLQLSVCDEYAILDETMDAQSSGVMEICWDGLEPVYRVQKYSGAEKNRVVGACYKADEYTEDNGLLRQTRLTPYDQTSGMAGTHFLSFVGPEMAAAVFCTDFHRWWDGSYAIDGYHYEFLPKFYCKYIDEKCNLSFSYPLIKGSRQTALAIYPAQKETGGEISYIENLFFHGAKVPLDVFKDWVLEWPHEKSSYPKFFDSGLIDPELRYGFGRNQRGLPTPAQMLETVFQHRAYRYPSYLATRAFESWTPAFDLLAPTMTDDQFRQWSALLVYFAYANSREETFPVDNMLAGHPNFLIDCKNAVGICAALFPEHPAAKQWKQHYEKSLSLLLKYHVRPEVKKWKAQGGRYTESYGTYAWCSMKHATQAAMLLTLQYGENPLLYPQLALFGRWLLNTVTPPIAGRRTFLYTGAHAGCHEHNPMYPLWYIRMLGLALRKYDPELSEQLLALCPPEPAIGHETYSDGMDEDVWAQCMKKFPGWEESGAEQILRSTKFNGYGFNLRANVGQEDEIHVFLQQLDEGLNYRWGRAAWGGCGNIYYHAGGKRYSGNRKEDFGDDNYGDSDVGCNFCVLLDHTYKSVGQNDLVHPLIDFGFVQYARLDAGNYSNAEYRYRSVMLVDNRYIAIYDAVRDERTEGRFVWHNFVDEPMPKILQLRPGVSPRQVHAPALTIDGVPRYPAVRQDKDTRGVVYDGYGDFLTLVTHRDSVSAQVRPYGAVVKEKDNTDYIFNANYFGRYQENGVTFAGKTGFARRKKNSIELAVIDGVEIGMDGFCVKRLHGSGAFSICLKNDQMIGQVEKQEEITLQLTVPDGYLAYQYGRQCPMENGVLKVSNGAFQVTNRIPVPEPVRKLSYTEIPGGIVLRFAESTYASKYELQNGTRIINCQSGVPLTDVKDGDTVRVRAVNAEGSSQWSPYLKIRITKAVPAPVAGLRAFAQENGVKLVWGQMPGASAYRLYKKSAEGMCCIWEGTRCMYLDSSVDEVVSYQVSALNGYGEGALSHARDTAPEGPAYFDPMPNIPYVRDTIVNLHGYGGFDYQYNENRRIFTYPQ